MSVMTYHYMYMFNISMSLCSLSNKLIIINYISIIKDKVKV